MTSVLDQIERELMTAIRAAPKRRRSRRQILIPGVLVVALAGGGVSLALISDDPAGRVLHSETPLKQAPDPHRIDLAVMAGAAKVEVTTYLTAKGGVGQTIAAQGAVDPGSASGAPAMPPGGAAGGFTIADNLLNGPLVGSSLEVIQVGDEDHWVVGGSVDARVRRLVVRGAGVEQEAHLAQNTITVPVVIDLDSLTPTGRQRAARMPKEVEIRPFAIALSPIATDIAHLEYSMTLDDGSVVKQRSAPFCVSASCQAHPQIVPAAG